MYKKLRSVYAHISPRVGQKNRNPSQSKKKPAKNIEIWAVYNGPRVSGLKKFGLNLVVMGEPG
jgi:hypothetical protein